MLFFDTETTGLLKPELSDLNMQPYVTEIFIAKTNEQFEVIDEFETLIKPPVPLPEIITKITGLTDDDLADQPSFIDIYPDLCNFVLGEKSICAHNASFDITMIANELRRIDCLLKFPWPIQHICTVEKSMSIRNKRLKLSDLYELATGETEIEGAHRAGNDVYALIKCYEWLVQKKMV